MFFVYLTIAALVRGGRPGARRRARIAAAAGLLLSAASAGMKETPILHAWLLPPILLLTAYWGTGALFVAPMPSVERRLRGIDAGALFVAPMPSVERRLRGIDAALHVRSVAARTPRVLAEALEFAYSGVYPTISIALWFALDAGLSAERFWAVVLFTDYLCFGCLPWIQSRPPRALEVEPPWRSHWRPVNIQILESGSVGVNTFPSGHAVEGLACPLLVTSAPWPFVLAMFVSAGAISAGAVYGRYHYAADAIAGWVVALLVWPAVWARNW